MKSNKYRWMQWTDIEINRNKRKKKHEAQLINEAVNQ